ncbi:carbon-nitrogen hydrolase family protein [Georgenia muralis]
MRIAVAQLEATRDPQDNLAAVASLVAGAAGEGAGLVVLPEYVMSYDPHPTAEALTAVAEPLDGPFVTGLARLTERHGTAVVAGLVETGDPGELPANTLVCLGPDGRLLGAYRKAHLYDAFGDRESERLRRVVPEAVVVPLGGLHLGLMTCYDLRFPEMARFLLDAGADVLLVPAAWVAGPGKADHWDTLLRARAIESTAYVIAAGLTGPACTGRSMVVGPAGEILARLGAETGYVVADVDPGEVARVRERNPSLANRRFDVRVRPDVHE